MHEKYLRRAVGLARENAGSGRGGPFGAVVARGDEVLAEAANSVTSTLDPTAHAEVNAIRQACARLGRFDLRGCVLYASCEPCPMCLAACYWARLDAVYYAATHRDAAEAGFDDSLIYREVPRPPAERQLRCVRLELAESDAPFEAWKANSGRTPY
jgi:guanine deaminase